VRYFSEHNEDGESQVNSIGEKTGKDSLFGLARLFGRLTEGPTVPLPALSEVGREGTVQPAGSGPCVQCASQSGGVSRFRGCHADTE